MELEQKKSVKDVEVYEALKENQITFSSANSAQSPPNRSPKKEEKPGKGANQNGHDCKKSKACNDKWGGLGCLKPILLYIQH